MIISGSAAAVTGVDLSSLTRLTTAAASKVNGAPRRRKASSGSGNADRAFCE